MINLQGITKGSVIGGLVVAAWVCVTFVVLGAFKVAHIWPAFIVLLLFFLAGANPKSLIQIMPGAVFGLLVAFISTPFAKWIESLVGNEKLAVLIGVFIILAVLVALKDFIPALFNNYALLYWTVALAFAPEIPTQTLPWILTAVLGGAFAVGGLILIFRLLGVGHVEEHPSE